MSQPKFYNYPIKKEDINIEDIVNLDEEDEISKVYEEVVKCVIVDENKVKDSKGNECGVSKGEVNECEVNVSEMNKGVVDIESDDVIFNYKSLM